MGGSFVRTPIDTDTLNTLVTEKLMQTLDSPPTFANLLRAVQDFSQKECEPLQLHNRLLWLFQWT